MNQNIRRMSLEEIKDFLRHKKGYLKEGGYRLAMKLKIKTTRENIDLCKQAIREVTSELNNLPGINPQTIKVKLHEDYHTQTSTDIFKRIFLEKDDVKTEKAEVRKNKFGKNVLIIGDLHEPFCLDAYLKHCKEQYIKYECDEVIFIGDIIDNHASSYHETDPDGHSAGQELRMAISNIKKWYKVFPKATVIIGNHDRIIMRKAYSSGLSKMWIKDYSEVLGTPGWNFVESIEIDNVLYIHGEGGTARARVRRDLQSVVQGHLHSQAYVEWVVGAKFKLFGMQVGCGVDHRSYAMAYGKEGPKPAIACGIVLQGEIAFNCMMNL